MILSVRNWWRWLRQQFLVDILQEQLKGRDVRIADLEEQLRGFVDLQKKVSSGAADKDLAACYDAILDPILRKFEIPPEQVALRLANKEKIRKNRTKPNTVTYTEGSEETRLLLEKEAFRPPSGPIRG